MDKSDFQKEKGICDCCKQIKVGLTKKKLLKRYNYLCSECNERMKYVNICLKSGTDKVIEKMPERYIRLNNFVVSPIESIS